MKAVLHCVEYFKEYSRRSVANCELRIIYRVTRQNKSFPFPSYLHEREVYISPYCRQAPAQPNFMKFGLQAQVIDLIKYVKFLVNRFRGYAVLNFWYPKNCHFPLTCGAALITVRHCDCIENWRHKLTNHRHRHTIMEQRASLLMQLRHLGRRLQYCSEENLTLTGSGFTLYRNSAFSERYSVSSYYGLVGKYLRGILQ